MSGGDCVGFELGGLIYIDPPSLNRSERELYCQEKCDLQPLCISFVIKLHNTGSSKLWVCSLSSEGCRNDTAQKNCPTIDDSLCLIYFIGLCMKWSPQNTVVTLQLIGIFSLPRT